MIQLENIDKVSKLTPGDFQRNYLETNTPVILTDLMDNWEAKTKWTFSFFKDNYGHLKVPVFSSNSANPGRKYLEPDKIMPLKEYLEFIENGGTDIRLFLYNIFNHAPELKMDFQVPEIMPGFYKEYPFTFFGGAGSKVGMHYDIDMSNVFLSQFIGRKRVVLFNPEQSTCLYQLPFTVASYIDVDFPDYQKYPALRKVSGYECIIEPGDTLFIPSRYWHQITYLDAGFSMSQRANNSVTSKLYGVVNIATHFVVDKAMNKLLGIRWREMKEDIAKRRAERVEV